MRKRETAASKRKHSRKGTRNLFPAHRHTHTGSKQAARAATGDRDKGWDGVYAGTHYYRRPHTVAHNLIVALVTRRSVLGSVIGCSYFRIVYRRPVGFD